MAKVRSKSFVGIVALFTRAWIEIDLQVTMMYLHLASPSSRGRGLKFLVPIPVVALVASPSSRGRGLK